MNTADYNVEGLAYQLIYRIENLLPEQCKHCKEEYCNRIGDVPLLSCHVCGQGAHTPCVFDLLTIAPEKRASLTPEEAYAKINPLMLPELLYLCTHCAEEYLPDKSEGLKKRVRDKQDPPENGPAEEHESNTTHTPNGSLFPAPARTDQTPGAALQNDHNVPTRGLFPQPNRSEPPNNGPPAQTPAIQIVNNNQPPTENRSTPHVESAPNNGPPSNDICSYYLKNTCRHGISGRLCPKSHPKACKKLLQNGDRSPNGCTLGKNCDKFHPLMCVSSLRVRACYNLNCKNVHVKGTKRYRKYSNTPTQDLPHIPRLLDLDLRPNQHIPQYQNIHADQQNLDLRRPAQSYEQNFAHSHYLSPREYNHDHQHTVTNSNSTRPNQNNQNNFLGETLHSINTMKQEIGLQLQQTLQKFREQLLEEMDQRLAPYPPLRRNNSRQENQGEQVNEGQYPGHREGIARYNQMYRRNPAH